MQLKMMLNSEKVLVLFDNVCEKKHGFLPGLPRDYLDYMGVLNADTTVTQVLWTKALGKTVDI